MTDIEIIKKIQDGEDDLIEDILIKYKYLVKSIAQSYYIKGGDTSDIIQEGMIGLYKAIKNFNINQTSSFKTFASLCIKNQILDAIKSANRQKHTYLNSSISLDNKDIIYDYDELITSPEESFIEFENMKSIYYNIQKNLTNLELDIFSLYLEGLSYKEMAIETNKTIKSIDSTLQRVKKKVKKFKED